MRAQRDEAARLDRVLGTLERVYPDVRPSLDHRSPWELLVATILSAQCSDAQVNRVTPELFRRYPGPEALAGARVEDVEALIRSIGLYRGKARSLVGTARQVVERHGGQVPGRREALEALPGVGRKTASVVLSQAFGVPAFPVDTHVGRVCFRLGFAPRPDPLEVERRVTGILAPERWGLAHLLLIRHGRVTCSARTPRCGECPVRALCPWPDRGEG